MNQFIESINRTLRRTGVVFNNKLEFYIAGSRFGNRSYKLRVVNFTECEVETLFHEFACGSQVPRQSKTTPMEISLLLSSISGVAGWVIWDIRSQAEKPIIKVAIATININDFILYVLSLLVVSRQLSVVS